VKGKLVLAAIAAIAMIPALIVRAMVIVALWAWFVVPLSPSIPVLHIAWAIGLSAAIFALHPVYDTSATTDTALINSVALAYIGPLLALGIGLIVRQWM
jgi:hypothetical protein